MVLSKAEELQRLRSDFRYFCEKLLQINPKIKELVAAKAAGEQLSSGPLIPFVWNKAQCHVWNIMAALIARKQPLELVVLKARQVGISTFFCAYLFWQMWRQTRYRAGVVAYEKKTTLKELNETMATFWDALPDGYKPQLRQVGKNARVSKEDVYFSDRNSACDFVVQKERALRGVAKDGVLCTETSFYDYADEFFGGFLPAMSRGPSSLLVMESSPEDGWFKDTYFHAKDGDNDRTAIFIPWWMCDDVYSRKIIKKGSKFIDAVTKRVIHISKSMRAKQRHLSRLAKAQYLPPITDEQIWWWICYCESKYQGDEEWMQQEFPDDDVTAFQRASRSAFKACLPMVHHSVEQAEEIFPDLAIGTLVSDTYEDVSLDQTVTFIEEERHGWINQENRPGLVMWEPPQPGYTYTIGADVADAEGEDDEEGERAFSVASVYCCNTRHQVAEWRGHIDPTDLGDEIVKLGYFYHTALLCVERNNMGRLTEHRIKNQLRYPFRFRWPDWNTGPEALTKKEMWETNMTTKPMMIGTFLKWCKDGLYKVSSPGLEDEMAHYRIVRGKFTAKDRPADRIIAAALSIQAVEQTEFAHRAIVLGANGDAPRRSASGMAIRVIRAQTKAPANMNELPDEFHDLPRQRVEDVFDRLFEDAFA